MTPFQISNGLTFGPLIPVEYSLINIYVGVCVWTFSVKKKKYPQNRNSSPISTSTIKKLRSFLKLQTPVQAELLSCSYGFSKKIYIFLAFRAKMLCSEASKQAARTGLAGESRECGEKGAQGVVELWRTQLA